MYNTQPTAPSATANHYYSGIDTNTNNNNNVTPLDDAYLAALAAYTINGSNNNDDGNNITQVQPPTQINMPHRVMSPSNTPNYETDNNNNICNDINAINIAGNTNTGCTVEVNPANMTCA